MEEVIRKDIISVLKEAIPLLEKEDFAGLIEVSNHTTHNASIYQDEYSIQIAVVVYSLSKILERTKIEGFKISINVEKTLQKALDLITKNDVQNYSNEIKKIFNQISEKDEKLPLYIKSVIDKAHIVKGSRIYSHGPSVARTAEVLGVSQWELMSFIGKTRISDEEGEITNVEKRVEFTKKLFRIL